jgi:hypothetical protein
LFIRDVNVRKAAVGKKLVAESVVVQQLQLARKKVDEISKLTSF